MRRTYKIGGRIFQEITQSHTQGKNKYYTVLSQFMAEMDYSAPNASGFSKASPGPRVETRGCAPPTGTIGNYGRKWARKRHNQETELLGLQQASERLPFHTERLHEPHLCKQGRGGRDRH